MKIIKSKDEFERYLEQIYPVEPIDIESNMLIEDFLDYSYPLLLVEITRNEFRIFTIDEFKVIKDFLDLAVNGEQ